MAGCGWVTYVRRSARVFVCVCARVCTHECVRARVLTCVWLNGVRLPFSLGVCLGFDTRQYSNFPLVHPNHKTAISIPTVLAV